MFKLMLHSVAAVFHCNKITLCPVIVTRNVTLKLHSVAAGFHCKNISLGCPFRQELFKFTLQPMTAVSHGSKVTLG
jgi:hypothetical protein